MNKPVRLHKQKKFHEEYDFELKIIFLLLFCFTLLIVAFIICPPTYGYL
ncbi:hypothetical protein [Methanobrevibacter sp. UBA337]